jgi:hypothetical protein
MTTIIAVPRPTSNPPQPNPERTAHPDGGYELLHYLDVHGEPTPRERAFGVLIEEFNSLGEPGRCRYCTLPRGYARGRNPPALHAHPAEH